MERHLNGSEHTTGIANSLHVRFFFAAAMSSQLPVAIWRSAGSVLAQGVIDAAGAATPMQIDFLQKRPGFVFAPFVNENVNGALQIQPHLRLTNNGVVIDNNLTGAHQAVAERCLASYDAYLLGLAHTRPGWAAAPIGSNRPASEQEFVTLVADAINFIRSSGVAKVVVSRTAYAPLPTGFDPTAMFAALCQQHPQAFVSLVAIPGVGTWLGASPEVLLTLDGSRLSTMALAGTQRKPEHGALEQVNWGRKEIIEQEMVSAYIRDFFRNAHVSQVEESGPRTVAAGQVVHLRTTFSAALPEPARLALANRVLTELHPTSAVCGMPKRQALAFILAHEQYDRAFYSGFLGPVHMNGCTELYVNLRCMQLHANSASIYMGAGITADSNPTAEWRETALKSETILAGLAAAASADGDQLLDLSRTTDGPWSMAHIR